MKHQAEHPDEYGYDDCPYVKQIDGSEMRCDPQKCLLSECPEDIFADANKLISRDVMIRLFKVIADYKRGKE